MPNRKYNRTKKIDKNVQYSCFCPPDGLGEFFLVLNSNTNTYSDTYSDFKTSLQQLFSDYQSALNTCSLSQDTQIFSRIYLSDIANQTELLTSSELFEFLNTGAISIVGQPPLNQDKLVLFSYHIKGNKGNSTSSISRSSIMEMENNTQLEKGKKFEGKNYELTWLTNITSTNEQTNLDARQQTDDILNTLNRIMKKNNQTLYQNLVRTWIYVRDIDNHYNDMVNSRRELFKNWGLTRQTRFVASTGIEGKNTQASALISIDALCISNLEEEQIIKMEALEHLSPTIDYNVTFERGTRIRFGDRSHYYISGTASINNQGEVIHLDDVRKQTERTLSNIESLLKSQEAGIKDITYFIVYLRNPEDLPIVKEVFQNKGLLTLPTVLVQGAVCRPEWLVEIECMALGPDKNSFPAFV